MRRNAAAAVRLVFVLVALSTPLGAHAQQTTNDAEARAAVARRLIQATGGGRLGLQAMDSVIGAMKKAHPTVPEAFWTELRAEVRPEDVVELAVPIYAKYLSLEDMQQLLAFYQSPVGRKLLQVQPSILQESMSAGQRWGEDLARRIIQRLRERGYGASTD